MTKEQFISGTSFYINRKAYKGDCTYYCNGVGSISRQSRSSIDERVVLDCYECNIIKIGRTQATCFSYVLGKKVQVTLKFADLVPFEDQNNN